MNWWQRLIRRRRLERDLDAELQFHFDRQVTDNLRAGMSDTEARREARLALGGLDQLKEACRDARGTRWLIDIARDVRHAVRSIRAAPGFAVVAIVVLALGIGASTAIFSVVDAVVLRGLPFDEADRLVAVSELKEGRASSTSPQNYLDWRSATDVFTGLAATRSGLFDLKREGNLPPESLSDQHVTANFFSVLRVTPLKGRVFTADDEVEGRDAVAVISYGLWQRRFGGAPDAIGKVLAGDSSSVEIVGIMPQGFDYPPGELETTDIWSPQVIPADQRSRPGNGHYWDFRLLGRLRDDVTIERAQARLDQINGAITATYPTWFDGPNNVRVEPLRESLTGKSRGWMFLLLGVVSFVLLLACINVANLLLARATTRSRELAVRAALGATRWDLARALLAESLVIAVAGASSGVLFGWWGVDILKDAMPADVPRVATIALNTRVLVAAAGMALATSLVFGLLPAISFSRPDMNDGLKDGGRSMTSGASRQWVRSALVVSEVALAVVLLVGAAFFLVSFSRVTGVNLGMDIDHVVTMRITPPDDAQNVSQRIADLLDRVAGIDGVTVASVAGVAVPMDRSQLSYAVRVADQPATAVQIDKREVSSDYFRALHVPLVAGRFFTTADREGSAPVAILNQAAARRLFGDSVSSVGRRIKVTMDSAPREIVGVVADVRQFGPEEAPNGAFFVPFAQVGTSWGYLLLRTSDQTGAVVSAVNAAIWAEFPDNVAQVDTLRNVLAETLAARRFNMLLLGLFGLLGLIIAALGVYGVMSHAVTQRTQEIGIRMALGATPKAILQLILSRAVVLVSAGLVIGVTGAWNMAGLAEAFLFEVHPHDITIYLSVGIVLLMTGLAAALVPALRAGRIDPLVALKME